MVQTIIMASLLFSYLRQEVYEVNAVAQKGNERVDGSTARVQLILALIADGITTRSDQFSLKVVAAAQANWAAGPA
jgi:hypothetical protein